MEAMTGAAGYQANLARELHRRYRQYYYKDYYILSGY
jgi:hypothetical protein